MLTFTDVNLNKNNQSTTPKIIICLRFKEVLQVANKKSQRQAGGLTNGKIWSYQ